MTTKMALQRGFKPRTKRLTVAYSIAELLEKKYLVVKLRNILSLIFQSGSPCEDCTHDPLIKSQLFYY